MDRSQTVEESRLSPQSLLDRGLGLTLLTGLALLLVIGVVFSVAYGSQQITRAATDLHKTDESLRSATVARAQVALAVYMAAVDREFGTVSIQPRENSQNEARTAMFDLATGVAELDDDGVLEDDGLVLSAAAFQHAGTLVLSHLESGLSADAQAVAETDFDAAFQALTAEFVTLRNRLASQVAASDVLLGRIGNVARFLVAFFIPVAVILIYRELARRRQHEVDLEHRLEAERELAKAREAFIANASHEFRTPLTSIAGLAMILEEDPQVRESPAAREMVELIIGESSDLTRMVEDLLTTARLDAGALHFTFEDVAVAEEVAEAAASLQKTGLVVGIDCQPGHVRADRTRLRQVVRNLLSNAAKYGGPTIQVSGTIGGQTYILVVSDDGDGLPPKVREHLFERFVHRGSGSGSTRTDSVGLGLSIVHALVVGMGGAVTYDYATGESRFTIRLPLSSHAPALRVPVPGVPAAASLAAAPALMTMVKGEAAPVSGDG